VTTGDVLQSSNKTGGREISPVKYPKVGKQLKSVVLFSKLENPSPTPQIFSCSLYQALNVIFWLHLPSTVVKTLAPVEERNFCLYVFLCWKVACHPVALICDIHQVLPYYYLNPCTRKHACSLGCFIQVTVLLHLLLLSKPEDGGDGKSRWKLWPSRDVAATSCEILSSLAKKLMLNVWPPCFQRGFVFPCSFFSSPVS